jgi:prepilin-type N-terminal cleavage/methylation domain-containing protein
MRKPKIKTSNSGFSLAEVLVGASIISVALVAILNAYGYLIRAEIGSAKVVKATYLLEEGVEASRYLRDKGWSSTIAPLGTTTNYYLYLSVSNGIADWQATTTKQIYDGIFERTVTFGSVYRSSITQDISSTGVFDSDTRKVTVSVSWPGISGGTTTKSLSTYLTNYR